MSYPELPDISPTKLAAIQRLASSGGPAWLKAAPYSPEMKAVLGAWLFPVTKATAVDLDSVTSRFTGDDAKDVVRELDDIELDISRMAKLVERLNLESHDPGDLINLTKVRSALRDRWIAQKKGLTDMVEHMAFRSVVTRILEERLDTEGRAAFIAALKEAGI